MRISWAIIFVCVSVVSAAASSKKLPYTVVYFPTDSEIVDKKDLPELFSNADWLKQNPDAVVLIEGHCDERESESYNMMLGDGRARYVRAKLIELGASEEQFTPIISYGKTRPADFGHNEGAWRKNRRVEFVLR